MNLTTKGTTPKVNWLLAAGLSLAVATPLTATAASPPPGAAPSVIASLPAAALQSPAVPRSSAFAKELAKKYVDPDRIYSSDVRWWLGEAAHTDEVLLEEIQRLYDAGFRGVELCMQNDKGAPDADYAYGSKMWTHKWNLMMNKLLDLGMSVYLTSGTNWATSNVPGLDPTSQAAMQNITVGTDTVAAGQTLEALPTPGADHRHAGADFVTAYAYKVVDGNTVDPTSFVELTPTQGGDVWRQNLNWTAPDDGTYRVFGMWTQGTHQTSDPSAEPAYTTNYFDKRGVDALRGFWERNYLADPALRAKIAEGDVQLFMDSLEIELEGGITYWSEDMAAEFRKRKGYDITPYLFLIDGVEAPFNRPHTTVADVGTYKLDGAEDRRQRIINDWQDVQTQLYRERMLQPLKQWLNSVGIETRAQISYGKPLEISEPIMDVDYPEAENLNQYNQVDIFRYWTGGAKLENKVLSSETSAIPIGWNATYQTRLQDAYSTYAAGFQRIVWHVWAAEYGYGDFAWPGFNPSPFAFLRFPLMGGRDPGAVDYDEFNAHLGRVQQLMQTGESRSDVGFITQKWVTGMAFGGGTGSDNDAMNWQKAHQGIQYRSTELQDNGYTYDYFSPRFLFDDDVRFDQRTKTIEKAGYKAVVLYQDWLDIHGARRLLTWAKRGLKVVILEDAASQTPFNDGKDGALKKVMDEMKTLPTVRQATVYDNIDYFSSEPGGYQDNVLEKLRELGVEPYAGYAEPNQQLLTQTRQDDEGNRYLYTYNYDDGSYRDKSLNPEVRSARNPGKNIKTDVEMQGRYVPYVIDAWTGAVTEVADYRWVDGKTVVPMDLDYNDISLMAFEKVTRDRLHVTSTDADSAYATESGVAVRVDRSGTVATTLSNGTTFKDDVTVPAAYDITDWDLTVESWRPSETEGDLRRTETIDGLTTLNRKTSTVKTPIEVELDELTTWDKIPEVGEAVSGTGHYEATFEWDGDAASGAWLDFGDSLHESMTVLINGRKVGGEVSTNPTKVRKDVGGVGKPTIDDGTGQQVPLVGQDLYTGGVNWMNPVADISDYLVDGANTIVVDYKSVLSNVQLDRGVMKPTQNASGWWGYHVDYLPFGPAQAKVVPFVDIEYSSAAGPAPTVEPKVTVRAKVRAGQSLKVRGKNLPVNRVTITLAGKKLAAVKVKDGRFAVTRTVPRNLAGKKVLRVLGRKGEVHFKTTIKVLKRKAG
ncbi:glycosyl hydrolase [Nocardioides sp. SYSU DS0663]|uniref:glycosyl hydrolase n=1 Tax=Nocardioides sp. SYSU DS0663 TaxID=3416445 RepID=UPI003F4BB6F2